MRLLSSVDEMSLQCTGGGEVLVADSALQWLRVETAMLLQSTLGPIGLAALLTLRATSICCLGDAHAEEEDLLLHGVGEIS